jgi:O-antigen ligase
MWQMPGCRDSIEMTPLLHQRQWPPPQAWTWLALCGAAAAAPAVAITAGPVGSVLLILGAVALLAAVFMPGFAFAAFVLTPFYKGAVQPYSPIDITVLLALLNALQIIPLVMDRRPRHVSRAGIMLWVGLSLLVLAGVLYAPDQQLALGRATTYWALVFLPILPAAARVGSNPRYVREFLWTLMGMGSLTLGLGLAALLTRASSEPLVLLGTSTISVGRAALLVPLLGVAFVLRERQLILRVIAVLLMPVAVVVALASGSRGPLLFLLVLGALGLVRCFARPRATDWRLVGLVAGVALVSILVVSLVAAFVPGQSLQRFVRFEDFVQGALSGEPTSSAVDTSARERVTLFGLAVSLFEDRPILGSGTASFEALSRRFLSAVEADQYPHNAVLQLAAEFGLLGVALFVGLTTLGLFRRLPPGSLGRGVRATFLFLLLNAMVSGDIFEDRLLWGLLMLVLLIEVAPAAEAWAGTLARTMRPTSAGSATAESSP